MSRVGRSVTIAVGLLLLAPGAAPAGEGGREGEGEVIRVLVSEGSGESEVRVTAVTGAVPVEFVAFYLDDFLVAVAASPPFEVRIDVGREQGPRTLRAEAFSYDHEKIAERLVRLNEKQRPFRVEIDQLERDLDSGAVELGAQVVWPAGRRLERVEFFQGETLSASLLSPPFRVRLEADAGAGDLYRVVAHLDDGSRREAVRLASLAGPVDRVDVHLVEIYAVVKDRAQSLVVDLEREDFAVVQGGRSRRVEHLSRAEELPLTLGLAVDSSDSVRPWMNEIREAATEFLASVLRDGDRAFLVDFATRPRLVEPATGDGARLEQALAVIGGGGDTALYDAVLFALAQFEGAAGRRALVVLTDGDDYGSSHRPESCMRLALAERVPVYPIVFADPMRFERDPRRGFVRRLAQETGGQIFHLSSWSDLDRVYRTIGEELRSQYLLTWSAERELTDRELRDVRVEVRDPRLSVRTVLAGRRPEPRR